MRIALWVLTIFLAAFGGSVLLDTLDGGYASDAGFRYFIGLVMVLTAVAVYARKLHQVSPVAPKQS